MAEQEPSRIDVRRYFDHNQVELTLTAKIYKVASLRGGQAIIIKALVGNTGNIYVGKKDVTTATGFELSPGESIKIEYLPDKEITERLDLFVVCATAEDDLCYMHVP